MRIGETNAQQAQRRFEGTERAFVADERISKHNRELICRYIRDARLGKTLIGRAKKKIGPARLASYISNLRTLAHYCQKDLDKITQEDMEDFIEALEGGRVCSRQRIIGGDCLRLSKKPLSESYKVLIKINIRKFYKWLLGDNRVFPPLVEWIDTYCPEAEIRALSEREVAGLRDKTRSIFHRALIQVLFDSGFRLGELLGIRLQHVRFQALDPGTVDQKAFFVRVTESKTLPRTIVLPMVETTKWLTLWIEEHPGHPKFREDGSIEASDVSELLFPVTDNGVRDLLRRAGQRALGKRVFPHLLRHSSATYWAGRLPPYRLCRRFGWTMTSKQPARYIDQQGLDDIETARLYFRDKRSREDEGASSDLSKAAQRLTGAC